MTKTKVISIAVITAMIISMFAALGTMQVNAKTIQAPNISAASYDQLKSGNINLKIQRYTKKYHAYKIKLGIYSEQNAKWYWKNTNVNKKSITNNTATITKYISPEVYFYVSKIKLKFLKGKSSITTKQKALKIRTNQTGINFDSTQYYGSHINGSGTWQWVEPCRTIAKKWVKKGKKYKNGICTLEGRYLIALKPAFGKVGDKVTVYLTNGTSIPCIIADNKGTTKSKWGYKGSNKKISVVEWEAYSSVNKISLGSWKNKIIKKIINNGKYI